MFGSCCGLTPAIEWAHRIPAAIRRTICASRPRRANARRARLKLAHGCGCGCWSVREHDPAMVWLVCAREIRSGRAAGSGEGTHRCTVQCDVPPLDLVKKCARMHACARPKARGSSAALLSREIRSAQLGTASAGESPSASSTTVGADGRGLVGWYRVGRGASGPSRWTIASASPHPHALRRSMGDDRLTKPALPQNQQQPLMPHRAPTRPPSRARACDTGGTCGRVRSS
jgi:hypothetical protein